MTATDNPGGELPWQWPEDKWRAIVGKVRAGRSLKPKAWEGWGALRRGPVVRFRP